MQGQHFFKYFNLLFMVGVSFLFFPYANAESSTCNWDSFSPQISRFPVQTDPNAEYFAFIVTQNGGSSGNSLIHLQGFFPYASYFSLALYTPKGVLISQIIDKDITTTAPNQNPFVVNNLVEGSNRAFEINITNSPDAMLNKISMPITTADQPKFVVVLRKYKAYGTETWAAPTVSLTDSSGSTTCGSIDNFI